MDRREEGVNAVTGNQVRVSALITRATTQQVKIEFDREGQGDDIVDQWADRLMQAMGVALKHTVEQASKCGVRNSECGIAEEPEMLRNVPPVEQVGLFYSKMYLCGNCTWWQMIWIRKGKRAPAAVVCERCECQTGDAK